MNNELPGTTSRRNPHEVCRGESFRKRRRRASLLQRAPPGQRPAFGRGRGAAHIDKRPADGVLREHRGPSAPGALAVGRSNAVCRALARGRAAAGRPPGLLEPCAGRTPAHGAGRAAGCGAATR